MSEKVANVNKDQLASYLARFSEFENGKGGPGWLRSIRQVAIARSSELGFPTPRDENWKFTNVGAIARTAFAAAEEGTDRLGPDDIAALEFSGVSTERLVFVNGKYSPALSTANGEGLPEGVIVGSLAAALEEHAALVEAHLAKHLDIEDDFFAALNTAFIEDGGFIYVPKGTVLERPIHLLYVATRSAQPTVTHPRNLIIVGDLSQAAIVEDYAALGGVEYFSNVATELIVGDSAVVDHYRIERESAEAFNVGTLRVQQGRSADVSCHGVLLGGALVRNNVHPVLAGEGGHCLINGIFLPGDRQHIDNFMRVEHASPHCDSRQYYNGILGGKSRGVFSGRIVVHEGAQKTDAKQTNRNLLLSDDAQIDSKPQLEIYADDVKCTHGATIGQLDEDAIFYLRARGISDEVARALLLFGFAGENLERMRLRPVREYVENLVLDRLPQGNALKSLR